MHPREPSFQQLLRACGVDTPASEYDSQEDDPMMRAVLGPDRGLVPEATSNAGDIVITDTDTVTDKTIGLMWAKTDSGHKMTFAEADKFCSDLRTGGFHDWRLPVASELNTLYDPNGDRKAACPDSPHEAGHLLRVRPEINLSCYHMWASDKGRQVHQPDWAGGGFVQMMKALNFFNGFPADNYPDQKENAALCVRKFK